MIIQVDVSFLDDARTKCFCELTGDRGAIRYLLKLWGWVAQHRPDLVLDPADDVEKVIGWKGIRGVGTQLLVRCGFLTPIEDGSGLLVEQSLWR